MVTLISGFYAMTFPLRFHRFKYLPVCVSHCRLNAEKHLVKQEFLHFFALQ